MTDKDFTTLTLMTAAPDLLIVTLNRPEVRNAISFVMMQELLKLWQDLAQNADNFRCVILTGSGDKAFCAGADLKARKNMDVDTWLAQHATLKQAMLAMQQCPMPIIAAVNGAAFGGGLELTMACDFAYASETAVFAQSEAKIGIMPGAMGTQLLPGSSSLRRAKELTFTAQAFSAQEAFEWGIINRICPQSELMPTVIETATTIASNAPLAIAQAKKALNASTHMDLASGYELEVAAYKTLIPTQDCQEGIKAFNEKRKPRFIGK